MGFEDQRYQPFTHHPLAYIVHQKIKDEKKNERKNKKHSTLPRNANAIF